MSQENNQETFYPDTLGDGGYRGAAAARETAEVWKRWDFLYPGEIYVSRKRRENRHPLKD